MQVGTPEELAAAREARGMSQVDISQRIKLQVKQVKALEQGDWDALPGRSFVRGALRSYGKLIDVDVGPLLDSVGGFAEPTQVEGITPLDAPISRSSGLGFNGGGRGSPILWVIAGLIGVVALVLYFGSERDGSGPGSWLRPGTQAPADPKDPAAAPPGPAPQGGAGAGADAPSSGEAPSNGTSAAGAAAGSPVVPMAPSGPAAALGAGMTSSPSGASEPSSAATPASSFDPSNGSASSNGSVSSAASVSSGTAAFPSSQPTMTAPAPAPLPPVALSGDASAPAGPTGSLNGTPSASHGAENGPAEAANRVMDAGAAGGQGPAAAVPDRLTASSATATSPAGKLDGAVATAQSAPLASARASAGESAASGSVAEAAAMVDTKGLIRLQAGSQASWIEVRQADGTALHNGLVKAGESIELKGRPPYRLVLGNASHVSLTYEGKARDLGPHMRANNIARLQLR